MAKLLSRSRSFSREQHARRGGLSRAKFYIIAEMRKRPLSYCFSPLQERIYENREKII